MWEKYDYMLECASENWKICDGSVLTVEKYPELFYVIGSQYGGDGVANFNIPDFRGRVAMHRDADHHNSKVGGESSVHLNENNIPAHNHEFNASTVSSGSSASADPNGNILGSESIAATFKIYTSTASEQTFLNEGTLSGNFGSPHNNMQPYIGLNYIIYLGEPVS